MPTNNAPAGMTTATELGPPPEVLAAMRQAADNAMREQAQRIQDRCRSLMLPQSTMYALSGHYGKSAVAAMYPVWRAWRDSLGGERATHAGDDDVILLPAGHHTPSTDDERQSSHR